MLNIYLIFILLTTKYQLLPIIVLLIIEHIIYKKSFGIQDFKNRYHSCRGNAYGLANTLLQTSVLRPQITNKKINNLFYTGQLTVPGPGVPPALISGKVVADYILKQGL